MINHQKRREKSVRIWLRGEVTSIPEPVRVTRVQIEKFRAIAKAEISLGEMKRTHIELEHLRGM